MAKPKVQMPVQGPGGIQNVIFIVMNTSVVWVSHHTKLTELHLKPKS